MGMSQLRIIFFMGAMNKMLEFLVTHGEEHRECETLSHISSRQIFCSFAVCPLGVTDGVCCCVSASEELVIEAEQKG